MAYDSEADKHESPAEYFTRMNIEDRERQAKEAELSQGDEEAPYSEELADELNKLDDGLSELDKLKLQKA